MVKFEQLDWWKITVYFLLVTCLFLIYERNKEKNKEIGEANKENTALKAENRQLHELAKTQTMMIARRSNCVTQ